MCVDKQWPLADRKTVSLLYLSIGVEGRRILNCKNPHIMIDTLATVDLRKIVEEAFIRPRNITFDRHVFLITKQLRGETVEHFYGKLKELAENCDFENKEETLIRDVFITNLMDPEIQKELLKQTVEPRQALELAINMELGMRNQHQIQQHNKIVIPANVNAVQFANNSRTPNWQNMNKTPRKKTVPHSTVQTAEDFGYRITAINVSQNVKPATIVVFSIILSKFAENKGMCNHRILRKRW